LITGNQPGIPFPDSGTGAYTWWSGIIAGPFYVKNYLLFLAEAAIVTSGAIGRSDAFGNYCCLIL
jgi:hypothetical protein